MTPPGSRIGFGPFTLDPAERTLLRDGRVVSLKPKAFDVLLALAEADGRLVRKQELMRRVWPDAVVEEARLSMPFSANKVCASQFTLICKMTLGKCVEVFWFRSLAEILP